MSSRIDSLQKNLRRFTNDSDDGLLQLLLAAAQRGTFERIIDCPTYPVPVRSSDLNTAVAEFQEVLAYEKTHIPTFLARLYTPIRPIQRLKRAGQFFTAREVAEWALSYLGLSNADDVCDAGAGTGVFADTILRGKYSVRSYVGVENDPILILSAAHLLQALDAPASFRLWYSNFLLLDDRSFRLHGLDTPNVMISNPPFVRFHYLAGRTQMREELKSALGLAPSSLSGSGSYFLGRSAEIVGDRNGPSSREKRPRRLMFFLPSESLGAAHAQRLREDLHRLHGWQCKKHRIPNRRTGVDAHRSNAVALLFVFEQKKVRQKKAPTAKVYARLSDLLRISRGISTGCNEFFVLTQDQIKRRGIKNQWLQPILPTRIHLGSTSFTEENWIKLRDEGRPCWLLALPDRDMDEFDTALQAYLREGIRRGLHDTPTARRLRRWFSLPIPATPPDVFITYFFRGAPRFILNRAGVVNLTNILSGRFVTDIDTPAAVVADLNKQAVQWMKGDAAGREYKGGLRKIEPRELSMLPLDSTLVESVGWEPPAAKAKTIGSLFD